MCDYSLNNVKTRAANVGDKLTVHNFGSTRGFKAADDAVDGFSATAVCVLPGTEIAFDAPVRRAADVHASNNWPNFSNITQLKSAVGIFCQLDKDIPNIHHDALEFAEDHDRVLLNHLVEGQAATVLQLPAAPKTEAEAKEQERLPVTA